MPPAQTNDRLILKPHPRAFGVWYLAMFILGTGPLNNPEALLEPWQGLLAAALIGLGVLVKARTSRLIITPQSIERRGGLIDRLPLTWPAQKLARVAVRRGLVHKALGVGVLELKPRDDSPAILFWGVARPEEIKAEIERLAGAGR